MLAARYRALGGDVREVGKPHALVYEAALAALREAGVSDASRVLAVGDSMHHDVAGARAAGVDSALVCAGVHAAELGLRAQGTTEAPTTAALAAFLRGFAPEQRPTHVIPAFVM